MHAILLSSDLMLIAAAQGAADRRVVTLTPAANAESLLEACGNRTVGLVIIDLRAPALNLLELVPKLRRSLPPGGSIVACGPHVHRESLAAAAAAGCDEVITRGEFDRRIDGLMARLTAPAEKSAPRP